MSDVLGGESRGAGEQGSGGEKSGSPAPQRPSTRTDNAKYSALVLGGGDPGDPFAVAHGVPVKALIPLNGKPMGQYVLEALRDSGKISSITYLGPTVPSMSALIDTPLESRGKLLENLEYGLSHLPLTGRVLVLTADIPLLTGTELRSVLEGAPDSEVVYPIVRREDCESAFPGVKRTYARLKGGTFTGGNLFLLEASAQSEFLPRLKKVLENRKNPLALAALFGPLTALKLVAGQLEIAELERTVSRILGVRASAFVTPHASVGVDVDKEADLTLLERVLRSREQV